MVLHAFVTSRIDYCMDFQIVKELNCREYRTQQLALLTSSRKYDHITPVLQELHWLSVRYRIHFKILLLTLSPKWYGTSFISDLINVRKHARYSLRSNSGTILSHPAGKMKKIFW